MKHLKTILKPLLLVLIFASPSAFATTVLFGDAAPEVPPEERFVRPVTAPYFHEDSFVTSDVRAWYLRHEFEDDTIGGDVTVIALQVRLALTNRLQLVAYKDGYTRFDGTLGDSDGLNDIGAGLKYALIQDWESQTHMAVGLGYEIGLGDEDVLQDTNEFRLWASFNQGFDRLHLGSTINYIIAEDLQDGLLGNADMLMIHLHADYYVNEWFSPVIESNAYIVTDDGNSPVPFSGVDAASLAGGEDEDTVTIAIGAELRPFGPGVSIRGAYETELTDSISLFGDRLTLSAVVEF